MCPSRGTAGHAGCLSVGLSASAWAPEQLPHPLVPSRASVRVYSCRGARPPALPQRKLWESWRGPSSRADGPVRCPRPWRGRARGGRPSQRHAAWEESSPAPGTPCAGGRGEGGDCWAVSSEAAWVPGRGSADGAWEVPEPPGQLRPSSPGRSPGRGRDGGSAQHRVGGSSALGVPSLPPLGSGLSRRPFPHETELESEGLGLPSSAPSSGPGGTRHALRCSCRASGEQHLS